MAQSHETAASSQENSMNKRGIYREDLGATNSVEAHENAAGVHRQAAAAHRTAASKIKLKPTSNAEDDDEDGDDGGDDDEECNDTRNRRQEMTMNRDSGRCAVSAPNPP